MLSNHGIKLRVMAVTGRKWTNPVKPKTGKDWDRKLSALEVYAGTPETCFKEQSYMADWIWSDTLWVCKIHYMFSQSLMIAKWTVFGFCHHINRIPIHFNTIGTQIRNFLLRKRNSIHLKKRMILTNKNKKMKPHYMSVINNLSFFLPFLLYRVEWN